MTVRFTKTFPDRRAARAWLNENGYSEFVVDISQKPAIKITLEGAHAVRAIERATKAKVIVPLEAA
jgi:hypothetical protein